MWTYIQIGDVCELHCNDVFVILVFFSFLFSHSFNFIVIIINFDGKILTQLCHFESAPAQTSSTIMSLFCFSSLFYSLGFGADVIPNGNEIFIWCHILFSVWIELNSNFQRPILVKYDKGRLFDKEWEKKTNGK